MSQPIDVSKESLPNGLNADELVCTTSESPVADGDWPIRKYFVIQADSSNTDDILFGPRGNAKNGYRLAPGETSPPIKLDEVNKVGIVAASGSQAYHWMGM
jgi:hypothetical protein